MATDYFTNACTISSLLMRWVVLLTSDIRELRFEDHSFSTSFGSLACLKLTIPDGRSIRAKMVFLVTNCERKSSDSWRTQRDSTLLWWYLQVKLSTHQIWKAKNVSDSFQSPVETVCTCSHTSHGVHCLHCDILYCEEVLLWEAWEQGKGNPLCCCALYVGGSGGLLQKTLDPLRSHFQVKFYDWNQLPHLLVLVRHSWLVKFQGKVRFWQEGWNVPPPH